MKRNIFILLASLPLLASAQTTGSLYHSAWGRYGNVPAADRYILFDYFGEGESLPILWGFDTAWNDYANMLRGIRHAGADAVGVVRVSFQPWEKITEKGVLPPMLQQNLDKRLANVALVGRKVDIALNLDGGENTVKEVYGGLDSDNNYVGDKDAVADEYARLIDATAAAVESAGYRVVSAAPFNEPDFFWNGTPIDVFAKINQRLKNFEEYPRFRNIRISGGNTLNCDEAYPWYETLRENLDEGNTHQLAGDFNHYADFFTKVREDGRYATADELHNVMEAMVGVEYGMQTGIWWGTAEQARGEFMKASFGKRLAYSENRRAWSAGAVYRAPSGKVQAFLGCSERQARPSTYNIVSRGGDVYIDGFGPVREYVAAIPGDPDGAYQTALQRNAETVLSITRGVDIQPFVSGDYLIVNAASHLTVSGKDGSTANAADIIQRSYTGAPDQHWTVSHVPENQGGDFSYYFITNTGTDQALDDCNWNLEPGGRVISYGASGASVQQWALEYDGDGWFHIRNKHSALYLECAIGEGAPVLQQERTDSPEQKWRFVRMGAPLEFDAPKAPEDLTATPRSASVLLEWSPVEDSGTVSYTLLRAPEGSDDYNTLARGIEECGFLDNTVEGDNRYSYRLMAEDASGNRSGLSEETVCGAEGKTMTAWYPLNETTDDQCDNAFSLRMSESPDFKNGPREGTKALLLSPTRFLQLPYSILQSESFSVTFWIRPSSSAAGKPVFATGISEDETLYLTPDAGGGIRLVAVNGEDRKESTAAASSGWTHIALVADKGMVSLYVNGEHAFTEDFSDLIPEDRLLTYFGKGHTPDATPLSGLLGDVRVYNYAIGADTVAEAMEGKYSGIEETGDMTGPVAVEYYDTRGIRLSSPASKGITIVRTTRSDGHADYRKIIAR